MNEPTVLRKAYSAPYVLDRGKLSRMLTIMEQRFAEESTFQPGYDVVLSNDKSLSLSSSQDLFALDNAVKNPIRSLTVRLPRDAEEEYGSPTRVVLRFDSDHYSNIGVVVSSPNTKWANELFSELEEQIDRTITTSWVIRVFKGRSIEFFMGLAAATVALLVTLLITAASSRQLSDTEAAKLKQILSSVQTDTERLQALVTVKLYEIARERPRRLWGVEWDSVFSKRGLFIALPIVLLVGTFIYLIVACYPWVVFAWGDYEQHHAALLARRRTLWTVIVASTLLGIISNLFVLSLPGVF